MKLPVVAFLTYLAYCTAHADSVTFSEDEARPVLAGSIQQQSQGKITLQSFKKTDGQKSAESGISFYRLDFSAELRIEADGEWVRGPSLPGARLEYTMVPPPRPGIIDFNQGGIVVHRGDRATISGVMTGQRTENGWKIEILESQYVSGHAAPATAPIAPGEPADPAASTRDPMTDDILKRTSSVMDKWIKSESKGAIYRITKSVTGQVKKLPGTQERYSISYYSILGFRTNGYWQSEGKTSTKIRFLFSREQPSGNAQRVGPGDLARVRGNMTAMKTPTNWSFNRLESSIVSFESGANICVRNLRRIESAKQQWALERRMNVTDTPEWKDLLPFLGLGTNPHPLNCPCGGTYMLNAVNAKPQCSFPDHVLP